MKKCRIKQSCNNHRQWFCFTHVQSVIFIICSSDLWVSAGFGLQTGPWSLSLPTHLQSCFLRPLHQTARCDRSAVKAKSALQKHLLHFKEDLKKSLESRSALLPSRTTGFSPADNSFSRSSKHSEHTIENLLFLLFIWVKYHSVSKYGLFKYLPHLNNLIINQTQLRLIFTD